VPNPTGEPAGTIVINTNERNLYLVQPGGTAIRYGIGVGREGFTWKGTAQVGRKSEWPRWIPPKDMLKRRPDLPEEMDGGLDNPLGARALYLFQGKKDTLFRIHGTNEPDSIGKAVSSGCIRLMNADVIDLYQRVHIGTRVVVLSRGSRGSRETAGSLQFCAAKQAAVGPDPLAVTIPSCSDFPSFVTRMYIDPPCGPRPRLTPLDTANRAASSKY
jgi:hypothetical protein